MPAADLLVRLESIVFGLRQDHVAFAGSERHEASLSLLVTHPGGLDQDIAGCSGVAVVRSDVEDDRTGLPRARGTLAPSFESESEHCDLEWFKWRLCVRQVVVWDQVR